MLVPAFSINITIGGTLGHMAQTKPGQCSMRASSRGRQLLPLRGLAKVPPYYGAIKSNVEWRSSDHRAGVKASNQACTAILAQTRARRTFSHSHPLTTLHQSQRPIPAQAIHTLVTASQSEKTSRSRACTSIQYQHDNRGYGLIKSNVECLPACSRQLDISLVQGQAWPVCMSV